MDHQLQSLLRQYSDSPSNELATQIANRTVRSKIDPKPFTFMEKCKEYNETVRILEVELAEDVKKELQNLIKSPVVSIKWDQYTPYFNDGDSCEFTVFEEGAMIQFEDSEEFIESWDNGTWDDTTREYIFTPEEVEEIKSWKKEVIDVWSVAQMKQSKDEIYEQKNMWTKVIGISIGVQAVIATLLYFISKIL